MLGSEAGEGGGLRGPLLSSFLPLPSCPLFSLWNRVMKYGTWKLWWPREVGVTRWESPGSRVCSSSSFLRLFSMPEMLVSGGVGDTPGKPAAGTPVGTGHGCHRPWMSQDTGRSAPARGGPVPKESLRRGVVLGLSLEGWARS